MSSCSFNSDCKDLKATCKDGTCQTTYCNNDPEDIASLTNDDLNCMNYIDSGPNQGCYACPKARFVNGKCSCSKCFQEPSYIAGEKDPNRCCSKIVKDGSLNICVDDVIQEDFSNSDNEYYNKTRMSTVVLFICIFVFLCVFVIFI